MCSASLTRLVWHSSRCHDWWEVPHHCQLNALKYLRAAGVSSEQAATAAREGFAVAVHECGWVFHAFLYGTDSGTDIMLMDLLTLVAQRVVVPQRCLTRPLRAACLGLMCLTRPAEGRRGAPEGPEPGPGPAEPALPPVQELAVLVSCEVREGHGPDQRSHHQYHVCTCMADSVACSRERGMPDENVSVVRDCACDDVHLVPDSHVCVPGRLCCCDSAKPTS